MEFTDFFLTHPGRKSQKNQYLTQDSWSLDLSKIWVSFEKWGNSSMRYLEDCSLIGHTLYDIGS